MFVSRYWASAYFAPTYWPNETTSTVLRVHTTNASLVLRSELTHTTDAYAMIRGFRDHTTDSFLQPLPVAKSWKTVDLSAQNMAIWTPPAYDDCWLCMNKQFVVDTKITDEAPGSLHNVQMYLNFHESPTNPLWSTYYIIEYDWDGRLFGYKSLRIGRVDGRTDITLAVVRLPNYQLNEWHRMAVRVIPLTSSATGIAYARIVASIYPLSTPFVGPSMFVRADTPRSLYDPADGKLGIGSLRSPTLFGTFFVDNFYPGWPLL